MNSYDHDTYDEQTERPITLREITDVVRGYRRPVLLAAATVAALFLLSAIAALALMPARVVTTLPFRLEFSGADRGQYPNGTKFSSAEIVSTPILISVYNANELSGVVPFQKFKSSIYVVEANPELEALEREYRAKLSDPKLSSVDRARLEQEFEEKKASVARSSYEISYAEASRFSGLPADTRGKILHDVLATWATQTVQNKGVVLYDLPILSSSIFEPGTLEEHDYIIALDILRSKINRVIQNIDQLALIPGAKIIRTEQPPQVTLTELRVRLEDQLKFRVDPMIGTILSNSISRDPQSSINFLRSRLRFNAIEQAEAENRVATLRDTLQVYQRQTPATDGTAQDRSGTGTVTPQFDQGFIDRLITMSGQREDMDFRQDLVRQMQMEAMKVVPLQSEAQYYESIIESMQGFAARARTASPEELEAMRAQIDRAVTDAVKATDQVNEIYRSLSQNLNPSTVLFSTTAPATTETFSVLSVKRIALLGVLLVLLTIPAAIVLAFLHSRITPRRDELIEEEADSTESRRRSGSPAPAES